MNEQQVRELLKRYRHGLCSEEESKAIEIWIEQEHLSGDWKVSPADKRLFGRTLKSGIDAAIHTEESTGVKSMTYSSWNNKRLRWTRFSIAASILFCVAIGGYFMLHKKTDNKQLIAARYKYINPGGFKATLTLSGGQQLVLTNAKNGILATQGNTAIRKSHEGTVAYSVKSGVNQIVKTPTYNTIATPRGGQYKVTLADGTMVWLNSASSIRFPTTFNSSSRLVAITGEAYFEVAHDQHKPFRVMVDGQTVEVLGTHFNVNAYADEPEALTTLLQGSVKVTGGNKQVLIKPGQQATWTAVNKGLTVSPADLERAVAWTNGNFVFEHDNIQAIMRQISRWYDVEVTYKGSLMHKDFVGSVSRFDNVADVLNTLQLTGTVHFKIEGRRITVIAD